MVHAITAQQTAPVVQQTTLPKITVKARGGAPQVQAYVNAYIVGKEPAFMNGHWATPLYYLSMVAMRGQGTTLQGVFARLVSTHSKDVSIDEIGDVALAHHQSRLAKCGYTLHWNFEQAEVLPNHDLHAVIESTMLTVCDPVRGMALKQREHHTAQNKQGKRSKERTSLSTAKNSKAQNSLAEIRNRERSPLFMLMLPGWTQGDTAFLQQLHLSFLDLRVPWPLDPSWARFLWESAIDNQEIECLKVWNDKPFVPLGVEEIAATNEQGEQSLPLVADAYFCQPQPARIQKDLQEALVTGRINSHLHTHLVALPSLSQQEEKREVITAVVGT